jgi:quinol monooxygenase YgiN
MLYLISTAHLKPGTRDTCLGHARVVIAASLKDPGCISYDVHSSLMDPDRIVFVERWADRATLDAHFATEHFKVWRAAIAPYVVITPADVAEK